MQLITYKKRLKDKRIGDLEELWVVKYEIDKLNKE